MTQTTRPPVPQPAVALGYAGAIPFVASAAAVWIMEPPIRTVALDALIAYGAVILSFMGGVRWGLAIAGGRPPRLTELFVSILPAFFAWIGLLLEQSGQATWTMAAIIVLIGSFGWLLWSDMGATARGEAPGWYPGLRVPLTLLVIGSLTAALAHLLLV